MRVFVLAFSIIIFGLLIAQRSMAQVVSKLESRVENPKQTTYLRIEASKKYPDFFELKECNTDHKNNCMSVFQNKLFSKNELEVAINKLDSKINVVDRTAADFLNFQERFKKTGKPKLLTPDMTVSQIKSAIKNKVCLSTEQVSSLYKKDKATSKIESPTEYFHFHECITESDVQFVIDKEKRFEPKRGLAEKASASRLPDPRVDMFEHHKKRHKETLGGAEK